MLPVLTSRTRARYFPRSIMAMLSLKFPEDGRLKGLGEGRVTILVVARFLVGVAQGFIFPSIHTVLAQWVPPHERSRSVSLTTSGMYLGAAMGMLVLPSLVKFKGPQSVFLAEAALGVMWSLLWFEYATDPPRSEHLKAAAAGFGESLLPTDASPKTKLVKGGKTTKIPWKKILVSKPVWAIVVNNFTFHYALYALMNWLPTYFEQGLQLILQEMGSSKMMPYLNMFVFSNIGGVVADHLITRRIMSVTKTRKFLNTVGFIVASLALTALPIFRTSGGAILCSSVALGFLALGRSGFAVNHMDIAPRYAGIVMGVSNTAGTLAGIIGVEMTGRLLEAAKIEYSDLLSPESWRAVFFIPIEKGLPLGSGLGSSATSAAAVEDNGLHHMWNCSQDGALVALVLEGYVVEGGDQDRSFWEYDKRSRATAVAVIDNKEKGKEIGQKMVVIKSIISSFAKNSVMTSRGIPLVSGTFKKTNTQHTTQTVANTPKTPVRPMDLSNTGSEYATIMEEIQYTREHMAMQMPRTRVGKISAQRMLGIGLNPMA
ncbi:putative anion transporter 7 [Hibiscus syriacus]|uniref:Anion transporter 7 n=1 Tax=Hibiscus syriacus TaxID=106335 RepID=A0A6A2YBC3_HIBSY|nr:putative anion transporter 7 [Hibiscus syriacus]